MAQYRVGIGETVTIPARDMTEDILRAKQDWARDNNLPDSVNTKLKPGGTAKILRAYLRQPRGVEPYAEVDFDENEVRVTGKERGVCLVDVIDEVSEPGGTVGIAGGHEVIVMDHIDKAVWDENQKRAAEEQAEADKKAQAEADANAEQQASQDSAEPDTKSSRSARR